MKPIKPKQFFVKLLESVLVIGYILFEELIWNVFAKPIFQYFKSLSLLASLKNKFLTMNRYLLLVVFVVILVITEVMGVLSGYYLVNGLVITGLLVYTLKIPIAAFTFWLFDLTKEKLMTFHWLEVTYNYIMDLIDTFIHSPIHIYIKAKIISIRSQVRILIVQYFGEEGFRASMKAHYLVFKPYIENFFKR